MVCVRPRFNRLLSVALVLSLVLSLFAPAAVIQAAEEGPVNLAQDPGFESGALGTWVRPDWTTNGSIENFGAKSGDYSLFMNTWDGYVEQTVTGLKPNTVYSYKAWAKVSDDKEFVELGVHTYGGTELKSQVESGEYIQGSVTFTTGLSNTSATIFVYKPNNGITAHIDDVELVEVGPPAQQLNGPDLVATNIAVDNANFNAGDKVRFIVTIKNLGDQDVSMSSNWWAYEVRIDDENDTYLTWGAGDNIAAGQSITVTSELSEALPSTSLDLFVKVDHGNMVPEFDETNNSSTPVHVESNWYPEKLLQEAPYSWKQVAIGGGGAVPGLLFHPKVKDLAYIRTDVGGALRWDPATSSWIQLFNWLPKSQGNLVGVQSLAVDPSDATGNTLYAALGAFSHEEKGEVYKSVDRGNSWARTGLRTYNASNSLQSYGEALAVDPNNGNVVYFASKEGLSRSVEAGKYGSWKEVSGAPTGDVLDPTSNPSGLVFVALDSTSGTTTDGVARTKTLYIGAYKDGIYRSQDGGTTWVKLAGAPEKFSRAVVDQTGTLYITADYGNGGVYKFVNDTWTNISPVKGKDYVGFSVDAADPKHLIAATHYNGFHNELFRSVDGGASWNKLDTSIQHSNVPWKPSDYFGACIFQVAIDPHNSKRVWFTDWYATWMTDDITAAKPVWYTKEYGHEEVVVSGAMTSPPSGDVKLYTGFGDVGGFVHTDLDTIPATNYWELGLKDDGLAHLNVNGVDFEENDPDYVAVVATGHWSDPGTGGYSTDGGKTFQVFESKPYDGVRGGRVAVSAGDHTIVWVPMSPTAVPYYSNDNGKTWAASQGAPAGAFTGDNIFAVNQPLSSDRVATDTFYLYKEGQFYTSVDGGANWKLSQANLPNKKTVTVRGEPGKAGHVWLAIEGEGLFRSTDYGATFEKLLYIQSAALLALGIGKDESSDAAVYIHGTVSGVEGVFRSDDSGKSWTKVSSLDHQLGTVPTLMAADRQVYGRVYVGTNGTGIHYGEPVAEEDQTAPEAPSQVYITGKTDDTMSVEWSNGHDNVGVSSYQLLQDGAVIARTTSQSYEVTGLTADTEYQFEVRAVDTSGNVSESSPVMTEKTGPKDLTPPTVPAQLQSPFHTTSSVRLTWAASSDQNGIKGYNVYMDGDATPAAFVTTTYTTIRDIEGSHTFTVSAVDVKQNESARSEAVTVDVTTATPGYVTGIDFIVTEAKPEVNVYAKGDSLKFQVTVKNVGDTDALASLPDRPIGITIETAAIPKEGEEPDWTAATGTWGQYADVLRAGESVTFLTNPWTLWSADKHDYLLRAQVVWTEWATETVKDNNTGIYETHATTPALPPVKAANAYKTNAAPTIDGQLNEAGWKLTQEVKEIGSGAPNNEVTFGTLWDDEYLYVAMKVKDSLKKKDSANLYEDDSVEVYIDGDNNKEIVYDAFDRQFTKRIDDTTIGIGSMGTLDGVEHGIYNTADGYTAEIAIPWSNLNLTPSVNRKLGLDIGVNDDDDGEGRDSSLFWSGNGNDWRNTSRFGNLTLLEEEVVVTPQPEPQPSTNTDSGSINARGDTVILTVNAEVKGDTAAARATEKQINEAIEKAKANKSDEIIIELKATGAASVTVELPAAAIAKAKEAGISIGFRTPLAEIAFASDAIGKELLTGGETVKLTIDRVDPKTLPKDVSDKIGDHPVFDFGLYVGNRQVSQFAGKKPVTVTFPYTLQAGEKPHQLVVYYLNAEGGLEIIKSTKVDKKAGAISFTTSHFSQYALMEAKAAFNDLNGYKWAEDAIYGLAARGIVKGISQEQFAPGRPITRAEFLQMLFGGLDLNSENAASTFTDVRKEQYYYKAVATAEQLMIVTGYADHSFKPDQGISRQEMAVMLERAIKAAGFKLAAAEKAPFKDQSAISPYAKAAVEQMQKAGIVQGDAEGKFAPSKLATRAEAAKTVYNLLNVL